MRGILVEFCGEGEDGVEGGEDGGGEVGRDEDEDLLDEVGGRCGRHRVSPFMLVSS